MYLHKSTFSVFACRTGYLNNDTTSREGGGAVIDGLKAFNVPIIQCEEAVCRCGLFP